MNYWWTFDEEISSFVATFLKEEKQEKEKNKE